ncbi:hypothetical protein CN602_25290 [Bacillus cereus]|uniref:hypothetical protein n=1 Tax=Bacillus cereus TaxID=1396 RepID=UPI000BF1BD22|nr:hypothetical protein [Bacillus cereus]PEL96947.1 hypothetical protein CN602_25290 [Bacillus cereus]
MELTQLEKTIVISTFITALGREELERRTHECSLEQLEEELEEILDESTLKQMMEAGRSGINKIIQDLLEESG